MKHPDVARKSVSAPVEWPWYSGCPRAAVSSLPLRIPRFADIPMIRPIQSRPDESHGVVFTKLVSYHYMELIVARDTRVAV